MVPVPVRESGEQATAEETSGKVAIVPAGGYVCTRVYVRESMYLHRCMHVDVYMHVEIHVCAGVWGLAEVCRESRGPTFDGFVIIVFIFHLSKLRLPYIK